MPCTMNKQFQAWASRPEVQALARTFIIANVEEAEEDLYKLDHVPGHRCMNFGIIEGMNSLYWKTENRLPTKGDKVRSTYNALAMSDDPYMDWRIVLPIFAWNLGFRPEGDMAAPKGTPELRYSAM